MRSSVRDEREGVKDAFETRMKAEIVLKLGGLHHCGAATEGFTHARHYLYFEYISLRDRVRREREQTPRGTRGSEIN